MRERQDQEVQHKQISRKKTTEKNLRGNHHENLPKNEGHERDSVYEVELMNSFPKSIVKAQNNEGRGNQKGWDPYKGSGIKMTLNCLAALELKDEQSFWNSERK